MKVTQNPGPAQPRPVSLSPALPGRAPCLGHWCPAGLLRGAHVLPRWQGVAMVRRAGSGHGGCPGLRAGRGAVTSGCELGAGPGDSAALQLLGASPGGGRLPLRLIVEGARAGRSVHSPCPAARRLAPSASAGPPESSAGRSFPAEFPQVTPEVWASESGKFKWAQDGLSGRALSRSVTVWFPSFCYFKFFFFPVFYWHLRGVLREAALTTSTSFGVNQQLHVHF